MEFIDGKITEYAPSGDMTIHAHYDNIDRFVKCGYSDAVIMLCDSRTITAEQRKKIYAMLDEISEYMGEFPEIVKKQMNSQCCFLKQQNIRFALLLLHHFR